MIYEDASTTFFSLKNQKEGVISNPEKVIGFTHLEADHEYWSFLNWTPKNIFSDVIFFSISDLN